MIGCTYGNLFKVTVGGGSYQDGLTSVLQGVPPGMLFTEQGIYGDLLLRKPGADELSSPRKEPDLPVIYNGINAADTIEGAQNDKHTNGTPMTILIPNLDRHFIHIQQYQETNRTPRPGHASYASFMKYGPADDAIGAGFFSGRYTATIVAAGYIAKQILAEKGIRVFAYIREIGGEGCGEIDHETAWKSTQAYNRMRRDYDPFYQEIYVNGRITPEMRFLEKMKVLAEVEGQIEEIRAKQKEMDRAEIREKYGVHHIVQCPDVDAAQAMVDACNKISATGDSAGGVVEVVVLGLPVGLGEPVFNRLDGELGRMLGIGAVKGVEVGAGFKVKDMTGYESNDQMHAKDGKVVFETNNAGGVTGGLSSGQPVVARLAIKPTPTIDKPQMTIDKYTLENTQLAAITRRDPTIAGRIWPVAENFTSMVILDLYMQHMGCMSVRK